MRGWRKWWLGLVKLRSCVQGTASKLQPAELGSRAAVCGPGLGQPFDTAEDFWIERPWTRSEQCPAANAAKPELSDKADPKIAEAKTAVQAAPDNRLALVQFLSIEAPRKLLRGKRPYAYTAKLAKDAEPTPRALRIRIEGRITAFGDGQPVHCVKQQTTKPPVCAVAVEFGKIALEDAATGEKLADWDS